MSSASFVVLDETGATTAMISRYGWGPRSERLVDKAPQGHRRTTTFVAGLRRTGIVAPFVVDGAITGPIFRLAACPPARQAGPGDRGGPDADARRG
jgi:hypothetical protein